MTTNVTDTNAAEMAADSRWSCPNPRFILYVDDTGFEKIALGSGIHNELAFTFAGNADLIADWKEWIRNGMPGLPAIPDTQRPCPGGAISMSVCCAHTTSNRVIVAHGCTPFQSKVYFAGSGAVHARVCWSVNGDARRAVESAKKMDHFSGGNVKYLAFSTMSHNLRETSDRTGLKRALKEKGMVMYHANQNQPIVVPVSDAMKTDPEIKQVMDDLQAGTRSLSAPCESMYEPWTEDERNKFGHELLDLIK